MKKIHRYSFRASKIPWFFQISQNSLTFPGFQKFQVRWPPCARWYWYNFCERSLLGDTVVTIFPKFWGKCRFYVLLNEIAQNFMWKIHVIRINSNTLYKYTVQQGHCYSVIFINTRDNHVFASFTRSLIKFYEKYKINIVDFCRKMFRDVPNMLVFTCFM